MLVNTSGCNGGFRSTLQNTCPRVMRTPEVRWNSVRAVQDQITRTTALDISADPVDSCEFAAKTAELPGGKANSLAGAAQTKSHQDLSGDSVLGSHSFRSPSSDIVPSKGENDSEEIIDIGDEEFGWHPLFAGPQGTSDTLRLEDLDSSFKDVMNTAAFDTIMSNAARGEKDEKTPSAPWLMKEALSVKAAVDEAVRGVTSGAGLTRAPAFECGATGAGAHPSQQYDKAVPEDEVVSEVPRVVAELRAALGRGISASEAKEWVHELDRFVEGLSTEGLVEDTINVDLDSSNPPSGPEDVENASKVPMEASSCSDSGARVSEGTPSGSRSQGSSPCDKDYGGCRVEINDRRSGRGDNGVGNVAGTSPGSDAGDGDTKDGAGTSRDGNTVGHDESAAESSRDHHPVEEELGDAEVSAEEGKQVSENMVDGAESRERDGSEDKPSRRGRPPSSRVGKVAFKTGGGGLPRLPWSPPHSTTGIAAPGCRQGLRGLHRTQGAVAASEESDSDARSPRRSRRFSTQSLFYGRREGPSGEGGVESRRTAAAAGKREEPVLDKVVLPKDLPNSVIRTGGACTRQGSQTATAGRRLSDAFSTGTGNERATERCRRNASKFPDDVIAKVPCLAADLSATLGRHVGLEEVKDCVRSLDRSGEGLTRERLLDSCLGLVAKRRRSPLRSPPKPKRDRVPMKRKQPHGPTDRSGPGSEFAKGDSCNDLRRPGRGVLCGGSDREGEIPPGQSRLPGDRLVADGEKYYGGTLLGDASDVGGGSCKDEGGASIAAAKREEGLAAASSAACRMRTRSDGRYFAGPVRELPAETGSLALGNRMPARWSAAIAAGKSSKEDASPSSKKRPRSPSKNDASSLRIVGSGNGRGAQEPRNGLGPTPAPLSEAVDTGARNAAAVGATAAVVTRSGRRVDTPIKSRGGDPQGTSLPGSPVLRSRSRLSPPRQTKTCGGGREALRVSDRDAAVGVLYKRARLVRGIIPEAVISKVPRLTVGLSAVMGYPVSTEEAKVRCRELERCGEGLSQEELCGACASVILHRDILASLNQSLTTSPLPSKKKNAQTPAKRCQGLKGTKKVSVSPTCASGSGPGRERWDALPLETKMEAAMETENGAKMESGDFDHSREGNDVGDRGDRVRLEGLAMRIAGALGQAGADCHAGEVGDGVEDQRGTGASSYRTSRGESELETILESEVSASIEWAEGCVDGRRSAEDGESKGDGLRGERVMDAIIRAKDGDHERDLSVSDGRIRPGGDVLNGDEAQGRTGIGTTAIAETCDRAGGAEAVGEDEVMLEAVGLNLEREQGRGRIEAANVSGDSKYGLEAPGVGNPVGAETEALKQKDAQEESAMDYPSSDGQGCTSVPPNRDGGAGRHFSEGSGCCDAQVIGGEALELQSSQTQARASTLPEKGNGNILDRLEGEGEDGGPQQQKNTAAAGGACLERLPGQGSGCVAVVKGARQGKKEPAVNGPSREDEEGRKLGQVLAVEGQAEARKSGPKQEVEGDCVEGAEGDAKVQKENCVEGAAEEDKASQHMWSREKCLPDSVVEKLPQLASDLETFMGRAVRIEDAEARCRELGRYGEGLTQQELCDACVSLFLCNDENNLGLGIRGLARAGGPSSPPSSMETEAEVRHRPLGSPAATLPSGGDGLEREESTKCLERQGLKGVDRERKDERACSSLGEDCDRRGGGSGVRDEGRDVEFENVLSGRSAREVSSPGREGPRSDDAIRIMEERPLIDVGSGATLPSLAPPIPPEDVPACAWTADTNVLGQESGSCEDTGDRPRNDCEWERNSLHGGSLGETALDIPNTTGKNRSTLRGGGRKSERLQAPANPTGPSPLPEADVPGDLEDLSLGGGRGKRTRVSGFVPRGRQRDELKHQADCKVGGYAVFLTPPEDAVPFVVGKVLEKRLATSLETDDSGKVEKSVVVVHWFSPKRAIVTERRQPLAVELSVGDEGQGDQRSGGSTLDGDSRKGEIGGLDEMVVRLPRDSTFSVSAIAAATAAAGAAGAEAGKLALTYSNGGWSADFLLGHSEERFVRDTGVENIAAAVAFFPKLLKSGALPRKVREVVSEAVAAAAAAAASAASAVAAKVTATAAAATAESIPVSGVSKDNGKMGRCLSGRSSRRSSGCA